MKNHLVRILLLVLGGTDIATAQSTTQGSTSASTPCGEIPPANIEVMLYVKSNIGQQVDRGECWDLAAGALNAMGAKWNGKFGFGRAIDIRSACIYPGDILQFEHVVLVNKTPEGIQTEQMPQHTAIIYTVHGPGRYTIAHQNNAFSGRKVGLSTIDLAHKTAGRIRAYRPTKV